MTELRKQQNIIPFGTEQQKEFRESGMGFGALGLAGKVKTVQKQDQKILKQRRPMPNVPGFPGSQNNGLASSLAMTPSQGMELINPALLERPEKK